MFILTIHDSKGVELKQGDLVRIGTDTEVTFYSEVKWLSNEQALAPFHTFTFHSFEKVDRLPDNAKASASENRYQIWYVEKRDSNAERCETYIMDWRACEHFLEERIFRVRLDNQLNLFK